MSDSGVPERHFSDTIRAEPARGADRIVLASTVLAA
jgi:hypothetical protein